MSRTAHKLLAASGSKDAYEIDQSLMFDSGDSAYLSRTPSSAGNLRTGTISFWTKRTTLDGGLQMMFSSANSDAVSVGASDDYGIVYFYTDDSLVFYSGTTIFRTNRLFRDTSAWYHIYINYDTTQSTGSDRYAVYINGVEETSFSSSSTPSQNTDFAFNNSNTLMVSAVNTSSSYKYNGYIAEFHNIDGTVKPVTDFGEFDSVTGQWIPKKYTGGSYGTTGFYLPFKKNDRYSVYFDDTSNTGITIADSTDWDFGTNDFTVECWIYRNEDAGDQAYIFGQSDYSHGANSGNSVYINVYDQHLSGVAVDASNTNNYVWLYSTADSTTIEDNKWYHVAMVRNGNVFTMYLDGTAIETETQNITINNASSVMGVGKQGIYNDGFWKGWISNFRLVMGTAVYTSNFTPPTSPLTAITNTKLLCCQDADPTVDNSGTSKTLTVTAANTYTQQLSPFDYDWYDDHSGQDNHYQADNLTVNDVMLDTPTNNYCILNSVQTSGSTFTQGNLKVTTGTNSGSAVVGTMSTPSSGKWYWETKPTGMTAGLGVGIGKRGSYYSRNATGVLDWPFDSTDTWCWYAYSNGSLKRDYVNGSYSTSSAYFSVNDVVGVALDLDAGTLTMYKNGSSQFQLASGLSGQFQPLWGDGSYNHTSAFEVNFGQKPFAHTPPSGFKALNTSNMPEPTIKKPTEHFNTVLWTGDGTNNRTINVGFQPDLVWLKTRNTTHWHQIYDAVRGNGLALYSNDPYQDYDNSSVFDSFVSNGFVLDAGVGNGDTNTVVAWNWKANGSGSSNGDGAQTTTVSANTTSGFSIAACTGTGSSTTYGHGLGTTPEIVILKSRSGADNWYFFTTSIDGSWDYMYLNEANGKTDTSTIANSTTITTSFGSGTTFIAYSFAEVEGFSKFGSYTGDGESDGPFINTGFKPAWIIIKRADSTSSWFIYDVKRGLINPIDEGLWANLANAETSSTEFNLDVLSNGFKLRDDGSNSQNINSGTFFYMAFAEAPFKYANAR